MDDAEAGEPDYSGMTVNERLFVAGLLDAFDDAARARDRGRMIALLSRVEVADPEWSVDAILGNPGWKGQSQGLGTRMGRPPFKVICISDRAYLAFDGTGELRKPREDERLEESLTVGKTYEVLYERLGMYAIIDDTGGKYLFPKSRFKVLDE